MMGIDLSIGWPFWPWHALQVASLASSSSAAFAGIAVSANIAAQLTTARALYIGSPPLFRIVGSPGWPTGLQPGSGPGHGNSSLKAAVDARAAQAPHGSVLR